MDWIDYRERLKIGFSDENKYQYFLAKVFNYLNILQERVKVDDYMDFCNMTGVEIDLHILDTYNDNDRYLDCKKVLKSHSTYLSDFLAYYFAFVNTRSENDAYFWKKNDFIKLVQDMLKESHLPFDVIEDADGTFIFPKGAEELDSELVSEPLEWMRSYPDARKAFVRALKEYSDATEENASDIADKFRKALETFFGGNKSLENYKSIYSNYLKDNQIPTEIANNFQKVLEQYTQFMNNYAKHRDRTSNTVLEYIMYQTGNIVRLLISLKQGEQENAD